MEVEIVHTNSSSVFSSDFQQLVPDNTKRMAILFFPSLTIGPRCRTNRRDNGNDECDASNHGTTPSDSDTFTESFTISFELVVTDSSISHRMLFY